MPNIQRIIDRTMSLYRYLTDGVWSDTRSNWLTDTIRTINLSVKSFLDRDLQVRSMSLTYQTILAIVPALALLFAIGRGFGLQEVLVEELYKLFPSQKEALTAAFTYVDAYLSQSSGGVIIGVGLVFLLWTLISLLSNVEVTFNAIWGVRHGRSFFRKVTDYTAIFLILPILLICSSGLTLLMSTALHTLLPFEFLTPAISVLLDFASVVMTWIFFAGAYILIPNCKVKIANALLAGVIAGTGFVVLQWLFLTGQMYVARYNAIYGSVAFLPLFLIWAQLAWLITLAGVVVCYSSQNIFQFSFNSQIAHISLSYRHRIALALMTVIAQRYQHLQEPMTPHDFATKYDMPARLVSDILSELLECGLLSRVMLNNKDDDYGLMPAQPPSGLTVGTVLKAIRNHGNSDFIPKFGQRFASVSEVYDKVNKLSLEEASKINLLDLKITHKP